MRCILLSLLTGRFLRQHEDALSIPESEDGIFDDYLDLQITKEERDILLQLNELSLVNGFEYAIVVNDNIISEPFTSYKHDKVQIPEDKIRGKEVQIFHSHTIASPLSATDYLFLLNPNIIKIGAICYNKDTYIVNRNGGIIPTESEFNKAVEEITIDSDLTILTNPSFESWSIPEKSYMVAKEKSFRIAQHFSWEKRGGRL